MMVTARVDRSAFGRVILAEMAVRTLGLLLVTQQALAAWCTANVWFNGEKLGAKEGKS